MAQETAAAVFLFAVAIPADAWKGRDGHDVPVRRFYVVLAGALVMIAAVQLSKGAQAAHEASEALLWAARTGTIARPATLVWARSDR